ncbi:MAG TPA: Na+/H+ antiporter subunit E [Alkalispirochaeta sp.]|nr:Na+/H+ antiporter subunit E [Alkalispirochaeta sp.]
MLSSSVRSSRIFLVLVVIWVIMQESFEWQTILVGSGVAALALFVSRTLILRRNYHETYRVRLVPALGYGIRLVLAIYGAGFQAIWKMFRGRINVGVVDIRTSLEDEFSIALLGNTITLIPGTVTLDRDGQDLRIIWLDCETRDPERVDAMIKGPFEKLIGRITR